MTMLLNPSLSSANLIDAIFGILILLSAWLAYFRQRENRVYQIGLCACLIATYLATKNYAFPPHLYICGYPMVLSPDLDDYENFSRIVIGLIAIGCSIACAELTRFLYVRRNLSPVNVFDTFRKWSAVTICWTLLAIALVHIRSELLATVFQYLTTSIFCVAAICVVLKGSKQRLFWLVFASTICIYLFFLRSAHWPYSYCFGPAPYLYAFYTSDDAAWVTAHSMFIWFFALQTGMLIQIVCRWYFGSEPAELADRHRAANAT